MKPLGMFTMTAATIAALLIEPATAAAEPLFSEVASPFGTQPCAADSGVGCWTNYLRVTDLDGDGDLDVVFVNYDGFFSLGAPEPLVVYANDGSAGFTNVSASAVGGYSARLRQVAIGDVDGDGDVDMYAPSGAAEGDAFFINDGTGVFADQVAAHLPGLQSRAGAARFADVDGDGDLDLFLADGYAQGAGASAFGHVYLNDGTGVFEELDGAIPPGADGVDPDDVDFFDADRDFDLDIVLNVHSGSNALWLNDGSGAFVDASDQFANQPNGFHYGPAVCDVDGDGDLDVWVDNMGPGYSEQLLINDGDGNFTDETAARVSGNPGDDDNGVICADLDHDGDFDAVVVSLSGNERMLENDGSGNFTLVGDTFPAVADGTLWGEIGDLNADGRLDMVTGQGEFGSQLNRVYLGLGSAPVDTRAPVVITAESPPPEVAADEAVVLRYAVSDAVVSDEGPRLSRAFARVATGDAVDEVAAVFVGGDLFWVELPGQLEGTTVSVELCAVDPQGNEGCADAMEYDVGRIPGGTEGTGDGTADGGTLDGGMTADAGSADATATASGTVSGGTSGSASDGGTDGDTDSAGASEEGGSGCGCRSTTRQPGWAMLVLALIGLGRGLRRRARRSR